MPTVGVRRPKYLVAIRSHCISINHYLSYCYHAVDITASSNIRDDIMKSTDKINNIRGFLRGKLKTNFGKSCVKRGNQLAIAFEKALNK